MTLSAFDSIPLARLLEVHAADVLETHAQCGDATAVVVPERLTELLAFLRDDETTAFEMLVDLCAVDHFGRAPRFEVHSRANSA